jgi:hypothetical protein
MEEKMVKIRLNLKVYQDRKKSYVNKGKAHREFRVGKHVFLNVKAKRSSLKLGSPKLAMRYYGSFEVLGRIGPVECMLALPTSMRIHNMIHVSLLKKCVPHPNHVIDWSAIQVEHEGDFRVEIEHILDWKFKVLRNKPLA